MAYAKIAGAIISYDIDLQKFKQKSGAVQSHLSAQRAAFTRNAKAIALVNKRLSTQISRMVTLNGVMAAALGGGVMGGYLRHLVGISSELFEISRRTGVATDKLQLLGRVFEQDGLTVEQMTKSLQKMQGRAARGSGFFGSTAHEYEKLLKSHHG